MNLSKKGTIISVKEIARRTIEVAIKVSEDFDFIGGQYIWLMIPELKYPDTKGNTRMFSIASSSNKKGELDIIFRIGESGYKKTLVEMEPGAEVIFSGPYGQMRLPKDTSLPVVLLAGGVGVTPFLSMVRFSNETRSGHKITLVYVNDNKEEAAYLDELTQTEKENPNFRLIKIFGQLNEALLKESCDAFLNPETIWHVVGSQGFVNTVSKFLNSVNISLKDVIFEQFYPYTAAGLAFKQKLESISGRVAKLSNEYPYQLALDSAFNLIIITDENGVILFANKGAENITGYTIEEIKGNTARLWGGLMPTDFYNKLWNIKKYEGQSFSGEVKNRRKNQDEYYVILHSSPLFDENNNLIGFIATEEDVTELKQANKDLENAKKATLNILEDLEIEKKKIDEAKAKDEAILSSIGDGLVVTDTNMKVIFINQAGQKITGWSEKEVLGKIWPEIMGVETSEGKKIALKDTPVSKALAGSVVASKGDSYYYYFKKDKTKFPVAITASPITLNHTKSSGAVVVFRDITKEKELDKAKTEFISIASHQLRTPVSGLNWITEALQFTSKKLDPKQKMYVESLSTLSKRLVVLVEDLLNISRIQLKTPIMTDKSPIEILSFVKEFIKEIKPYSDSKKHTIVFNKDVVAPVTIEINKKSLYNVLQNLVSNAIEYSPENTAVIINLEKTADSIKVSVSNKGPVITKDEQLHLFKRFYRGESAKKIKAEGTGLGLYIIKMIIEEMGGKVGFESKKKKDTVFWFTLPLKTAIIDKDKPNN